MAQNAKNKGKIGRFLLRALGPKRSYALMARIVAQKYKSPSLCIPKPEAVKSILFIAPQDQLALMHQLSNIISLLTLYKDASAKMICNSDLTKLVSILPGIEVFTCDPDRKLFSIEYKKLISEVKHKFDACFMLDDNPNIFGLMLAGATGAPLRVGYVEAGTSPFLNFRIKRTGQHPYLPDANISMARTLNAPIQPTPKCTVSKKSLDDINHLLQDARIPLKASIIGIDMPFFIANFGRDWTSSLIDKVKQTTTNTLISCSTNDTLSDDAIWMASKGVVFIPEMSVSRTAALVTKSQFTITGKAPLYELSRHLHIPVIGIFNKDEVARYCKESHHTKAVVYENSPNDLTIQALCNFIRPRASSNKDSAGQITA